MKVPQTYRIKFNYRSTWGEVIKSGSYPASALAGLSSERIKELQDRNVLSVESWLEVPNAELLPILSPSEEASPEETPSDEDSTPKPRRSKKPTEGK